MRFLLTTSLLLFTAAITAANESDIAELLGREIIGPDLSLKEVQDYTEAQVLPLSQPESAADWDQQAAMLRAAVLENIVYRGAAIKWRDAKTKVEWLGAISGGPGYHIKKLRYEALPGLWIPALLYEPDKIDGKTPVVLNLNGHEGEGKSVDYKQVRCINLAKRGMLALHLEWIGTGQLNTEGFDHYKMNQLDLCGVSGLAPFYLSMKRGLDVLLAHENADPRRVAVTGLSGGGWQTIFLSALDPRVSLANPVAGYSSFRTRARQLKDLGDSEQTPCDLATIVDYTHLTAMMAPRPTLLTFNATDNCCFEAGYALPPLLDAARPFFRLYEKENAIRSHVNVDPGTHNYLIENREAFYRMLGDFFYPGDASYSSEEIASDDEVTSAEELNVELPENADFNTLALAMQKNLPNNAEPPEDRSAALKWQEAGRKNVRSVVEYKDYEVDATKSGDENKDGLKAAFWKLRLGGAWTVPAVELSRGDSKGTTIVVADAGRRSVASHVDALLAAGQRVIAVDPFYLGESKIAELDFLYALLISAVGDRPLGLQASQLTAFARWSLSKDNSGPVTLVAIGPRCATAALVASALEEHAIGKVELHDAMGSLKEVIEQNLAIKDMPELFCFGLLATCDIKQLAALSAPRPVQFVAASARARTELAGLGALYRALGNKFEPLQ